MFDPNSNKSYGPALQKIAEFLLVKLNTTVKKKTGNEYYTIEAKGIKSVATIIKYLNTYSLFSSKYLDYRDWEKVGNFIISQTHYAEENSALVDELKNGMNNKRENFDWTHLNKISIASDSSLAVLSCAFWSVRPLFFFSKKKREVRCHLPSSRSVFFTFAPVTS